MIQQVIQQIQSNELLSKVLHLKNKGFRLAAISCTNKDGMELSYSFDRDYEFITLRVITDSEERISSISVIYPYAFLYENEIKELFGVNIKDISADFKNTLYKIPVTAPFGTKEGKN